MSPTSVCSCTVQDHLLSARHITVGSNVCQHLGAHAGQSEDLSRAGVALAVSVAGRNRLLRCVRRMALSDLPLIQSGHTADEGV